MFVSASHEVWPGGDGVAGAGAKSAIQETGAKRLSVIAKYSVEFINVSIDSCIVAI